ncbi:MAG: ribbon-helix-helix protein, CopG family [Thaumarchaeota archaeon]|nr:ribbon-helix-helix protein, CopG family [Nitrososphaerota archaeon]
MKKFLQTLDESVYTKLEKLAKKRGISVQELVRAVIIPGWLEEQRE